MCYHIISPKKFEFEKCFFSGKDELMGNLKAAALACGVVASVLGGGFGVAYITSSTVKPADVLIDENDVISDNEKIIGSTTANIASATKAESATTYNRTTTKKSYIAEITTAASKISNGVTEGTTSQNTTMAATKAAQISRSVPAPAHAPAALTEPVTQAFTTAAMVEKITSSAAKISTTTVTEVVTQATTTTVATTAPIPEETAPPVVEEEYYDYEEPAEEPEPTPTYVEVQEEEPVVEEPVVEEQGGLPISDSDYILLCNAVANEAGSNWIGNYEKAYVVEVIMNRVNSPLFPNTIYNVLTQRYQFSGASTYVNLGTYSNKVTQSVKDAVTLYFTEPQSFTQGYFYFQGDGLRNYFR